MSRRILVLVAVVAVGAAVYLWVRDAGPARPVLHARELVRAELLDPESATFRYERVRGNTVCGEFNARNKFGGYVGFAGYIADLERGTAFRERPGASELDQASNILFEQSWRLSGCGPRTLNP